MKSIKQVKPKMNAGQKIKLFFKRHIIGIIASLIALGTWWVEKVEVADSEYKISDFFRLENEIHQIQTAIILHEMETFQTQINYKSFPNDSAYQYAFFQNVVNEVQEENTCFYTLRKQSDLDGIVGKEIYDEKEAMDKELQDTMNTGNFNIIHDYAIKHRTESSEKSRQLQNSSQEILNKLWFKSKRQFNTYIFCYLVAAFLFFIDRIKNVSAEES